MSRRPRSTILAALSMLIVGPPAFAQEAADQLVGSWRLLSFKAQIVGDDAEPRDFFGPAPFGRLILTPAHTMAAFLSRPDRKPPTDDAEAATLLRSMTAYTGRFRVEGDKFITTVDGAWNEVFKSHEQVRIFKVEGDTLTIRVPEQPSGLQPGKRNTSVLIFEREK
jgi:Lipocalin-like domain